jgi:thioredoxin reductase (NADPH)
MDKPVILAVDDDLASLAIIERELKKRYRDDYRIVAKQSAADALDAMRRLHEEGEQLAILLADQWMPEMPGVEFLGEARLIDPLAKRVMLVAWGDPSAPEAIFHGCAYGQIEYFLAKPWHGSPDEQFHHEIADLLYQWSRTHRPVFEAVKVVGEQWSRRSHELRDLLQRNGIPYGFYAADSEEGSELLLDNGLGASARLPAAVVFGGKVLEDPSNRALSEALGVQSRADAGGECDLVVIGAGPAGLAAAVYGSSEGLATVVVEGEALGGQAGQSTMIQNYLGFPAGISGEELTARAYQQAWEFGTQFLFANSAVEITPKGDRFTVALADGSELCASGVIVASGISYRRLEAPRLEALMGAGVFYGSVSSEARALGGDDVFVVGAGNSAGQAALHLSRYARSVTLVVRRDGLEDTMSHYLITMIERTPNMHLMPRSEVVDGDGPGRLTHITVRNLEDGTEATVAAQALFVMIGATPHTEWLPEAIARDKDGFVLTGTDLTASDSGVDGVGGDGGGGNGGGLLWTPERPPYPLETSLPGVFAVGDVRHGSVKRVAAAVGEGAIAVRYLHEYLAARRLEHQAA